MKTHTTTKPKLTAFDRGFPAVRLTAVAALLSANACIAADCITNGDFENTLSKDNWFAGTRDGFPKPPDDNEGMPKAGNAATANELLAALGLKNRVGVVGAIGLPKANEQGELVVGPKVNGVPGAVLYHDFKCEAPGKYCKVTYSTKYFEVAGEHSNVFLGLKTEEGDIVHLEGYLNADRASGTSTADPMVYPDCGQDLRIAFYITTDDLNKKAIESTLLVDNVTCECADSATPGGASFKFDMTNHIAVASAPAGPGKSVLAFIPLGYSAVGNFLAAGNNAFADVLSGARADTLLFRWDSKAQTFSKYIFGADGTWQPPGGTFAPGESAIIYSASEQLVALTGREVPQVPRPRRPAGRYLVSTTEPRPQRFHELMGFAPAPGDRVLKFIPASWDFPLATLRTSTYSSKGWDVEPVVNEGEGVFVELVNTGVVIGRDQLKLQLGGPRGSVALLSSLPIDSQVTLQTAPSPKGPWTSVTGVQTPFFPPLDAQTKFFRLFMAP